MGSKLRPALKRRVPELAFESVAAHIAPSEAASSNSLQAPTVVAPPCGSHQAVRVLQVYRTYLPDTQGGIEEVIRQICVNTRPHGVDNRVLALSPNVSRRAVRRVEARVYRAHRDLEIASCGMSLEAFAVYRRLAA